jgi:hypothetical protein
MRRARSLGWLAGVLGLLLGAGPLAPLARAAKLRPIVASAERFASDGGRYAAWQVKVGGPLTVLDTVSGARHALQPPTGCELENGEDGAGSARRVASAGRFLLRCPTGPGGITGLLDVADGRSVRLPQVAPAAEWIELGSRYVQGYDREAACPHSQTELQLGETGCKMLYDVDTAVVSFRPQGQLVNLYASGAPPECPAVQIRGRSLSANALQPEYADGTLVFEGSRHEGEAEIVRCHGRAATLHGRGELRNASIGGGLLTWDNGLNPTESGTTRERRTLTSYGLSSRRRHSWPLPAVAVHGQVEPARAEPYGYSSHTANTVFWIAPTAVELGQSGGAAVLRSSVYAARL